MIGKLTCYCKIFQSIYVMYDDGQANETLIIEDGHNIHIKLTKCQPLSTGTIAHEGMDNNKLSNIISVKELCSGGQGT